MDIIERRESAVRSYCRAFPATLARAAGAEVFDTAGRRYLDFFAGAGALNYGHNPPALKAALLAYLEGDGITHALDLTTQAKRALLETLEDVLLAPRGLPHRVMFPGPTGTNAVESALKLARKATGRAEVVRFVGGFHGMTLGALAVTSNPDKRSGAGVPLPHTVAAPFGGALEAVERLLRRSEGAPAAVIVETVQAEGGVRPASAGWLQGLRALTRAHGVPLIVDDIQVGCGRTGPFFSFEEAGIVPDIVCLSKSLSGYGLPLSLVLVHPALDVLAPGEHNGTFRGFNPAFVTARVALETWWRDDRLRQHVADRAAQAQARLEALAAAHGGRWRGRGLIQGVDLGDGARAAAVSRAAFARGLIMETAGAAGEVLKLLCPLTITADELDEGLDIVEAAMTEVPL